MSPAKLLWLLPVVIAGLVIAADPIPPEPHVFEAGGGVCVYYGGQLECFCPCQSVDSCEEVPTVVHAPTVTQAAPDPTEGPAPTVERCNRGLGNGSEGCDPGNSGGRPGSAGEENE